jgi:5-methylcytosine-specific restriction endonuclease McrA
MRICSGAGCTRTVPDTVTFCHECTPKPVPSDGIRENVPAGKAAPSSRDGRKLTGQERGYTDEIAAAYSADPTWRKVTRPQTLQRFPFCAICKREVSRVADHIIPARIVVAACRAERMFPMEKLPGFNIRENTQGLCHGCHNEKTASEAGKDYAAELETLLAKFRGRKWFSF